MSTFENLSFTDSNYVGDCALTTDVDPVTSVNWLKNEWRGRKTKWTNLATDIEIQGVLDEPVSIDYFAIAGHNLVPDAQVKLELFATDVSTTDLLGTGFQDVGSVVPLGFFEAGIDPYGELGESLFGENIMHLFDEWYTVQKFKLTIQHELLPDSPTYVDDGIFRQDDTSGILSIEAESSTVIPAGADTWESISDGTASGSARMYNDSDRFYSSRTEGPCLVFDFTASRSGSHEVWARFHSTDGNSIYTVFPGAFVGCPVFNDLVGNGWQWIYLRDVTLVDEQVHTFIIAARSANISVDKLVIQPSGTTAPTGTGPAESDTGTILSNAEVDTQHVSIRMLMMGRMLHMRNNFMHGNSIKFLTEPDLYTTHSGYSVPARYQRHARQMEFNLGMMNDRDRFRLWQFETSKSGKAFMVVPYPDRHILFKSNYLYLARFADALGFKHTHEGLHQSNMKVVEV